MTEPPKPLVWIASSEKDVKTFPRPVQRDLGHALEIAQFGLTPVQAKPLRGFKGAEGDRDAQAGHRSDQGPLKDAECVHAHLEAQE